MERELPKTASGTRLMTSRMAAAFPSSVRHPDQAISVAFPFSHTTDAAITRSFGIPKRRTAASITQVLVDDKTAQIDLDPSSISDFTSFCISGKYPLLDHGAYEQVGCGFDLAHLDAREERHHPPMFSPLLPAIRP